MRVRAGFWLRLQPHQRLQLLRKKANARWLCAVANERP